MTMKTLRRWLVAVGVGGVLTVTAVMAIPPAGQAVATRVGQPAPEITGGPWINSEPLTMEKLRGRVVAVEFWTFG